MNKQDQGSKALSATGHRMEEIFETQKRVLIMSHHKKNETVCSLYGHSHIQQVWSSACICCQSYEGDVLPCPLGQHGLAGSRVSTIRASYDLQILHVTSPKYSHF